MRLRFIAISFFLLGILLDGSNLPAQDSPAGPVVESSTDRVGRWREDVIVTPVNQLLTPFGKQIELPGLRCLLFSLLVNNTSWLPMKRQLLKMALSPSDSTATACPAENPASF